MHNKLTEYRYCTDMSDLQYGYYIRWIPLKDPENLYLTNGGIMCDMKIVNNVKTVTLKNRVKELENRLNNLKILVDNIAFNQQKIVEVLTPKEEDKDDA